MVSTLEIRTPTRTETAKPDIRRTLRLIGEELEIPIAVRPWWGSARRGLRMSHTACGFEIFPPGLHCWICRKRHLAPWEVSTWRDGRWVCPDMRWPEVEGGVVVLWEGLCGAKLRIRREHVHRQSLEVLDRGATAFLLRVTVGHRSVHFVVGKDGGAPFVTAVSKTATTLEDAFRWMMPAAVQRAIAEGKDVKRQGDWFFVPFGREPRPTRYDYQPRRDWPLATAGPSLGRQFETRHIGDFVAYLSILEAPGYVSPVVKGTVTAPDHPPLRLDEEWHVAMRRRALPGNYARRSAVDD